MSIPKYDEMYDTFLQALADGQVHTMKDLRRYVATSYNLSKEELSQLLPSGLQSVFENRIGWTRTYLKKAGLIISPKRGEFIISEEGSRTLSNGVHVDNSFLLTFPSFREFQNRSSTPSVHANSASDQQSDISPEERLEIAFDEMNNSLADDLMSEIMKLDPSDFEQLVVKLLLKMGYGSGIDDAAYVTQVSNDGGIDGIIKEDQLGFSSIYIQAKRWDPSQTISRPEIQKFVGALRERNSQKGLFITTASFSSGAKESAERAGIVLVDGKQLTRLMIKNNLGVSVEREYLVKKIDTDFFMEGL